MDLKMDLRDRYSKTPLLLIKCMWKSKEEKYRRRAWV